MLIFDPSMSAATIQSQINTIDNAQQSNQFGQQRYALLFKPGTYNENVQVGYYTQVLGLGLSPNQTVITGGGVTSNAQWFGGNATQNFWRSAENFTDDPSSGTTEWAVSQASPMRRVHVEGNMILDDNGGWSSGGFIGDSVVDGQVNSGSQQQFLSRNDQFGSWTGSNWNMVFVGDTHAPAQSFPSPPDTTVASTPSVAEKPFLYVDSTGAWQVFVPSLRTNSSGTTWAGGNPAGTSLPISQFYIAKPSDTAATINAALTSGQNLLFTPGVYHLTSTINVNRADTVVLGLGLATLEADNGVTAMSVADVNGVKIGGLLFDAGTTNSAVLLQVGPSGSSADHSADPTILADVFARIGGAAVGKATVSVLVNSNNVIGDDLWLWRADHGSRRRLDVEHGSERARGQRSERHHVRPRRRALPAVFGAVERQRRPDVLLPERVPVRRTEPGQLDERQYPRLGVVQGGQHGDHARGVGRRCLLLLQHELGGRGRPRVRGATGGRCQVP